MGSVTMMRSWSVGLLAVPIVGVLLAAGCERPALNAASAVPAADASGTPIPCPGPDVPLSNLPAGPCNEGAECPINAYQLCPSGERGIQAAFICSCPKTGLWDCAFQFQTRGSCPAQPIDASPPDGAFSR
jgi:hypothetical protein